MRGSFSSRKRASMRFLHASLCLMPRHGRPARMCTQREHPAMSPKRRKSSSVMKSLFGRRPDGRGGGRSATASAGSTTAPRAAGEASPWRRTQGNAVAACNPANDQRSEAGP
eukprot:10247645-Alexandrium_andersonii.AAC.1